LSSSLLLLLLLLLLPTTTPPRTGGGSMDILRNDAFGLSAIHHACAVGNVEMAKVLIEHKADARARTLQARRPSVHIRNHPIQSIQSLFLDDSSRLASSRRPFAQRCVLLLN
jgi:ankyrin repeat protein